MIYYLDEHLVLKNEIYIKLQMCYNKNTNGKSKI